MYIWLLLSQQLNSARASTLKEAEWKEWKEGKQGGGVYIHFVSSLLLPSGKGNKYYIASTINMVVNIELSVPCLDIAVMVDPRCCGNYYTMYVYMGGKIM